MGLPTPKIVSPEEWEAARAALLVKEKEVTRARDALAAARRRMPMVLVEKAYRFEGPDGPATLLDLFDGRRQLVLYRFFMDPGMSSYPERGCKGCSLGADQLGNLAHLRARDTNYVAVSRGAQEHLQRYRERMGWTFPWYTTLDDFSEDFGVGEWHGTNVFLRDDEDRIYRTYFVADRGDEHGDLWTFLDLTPYGRQEEWEDSPEGWPPDAAIPVVALSRPVRVTASSPGRPTRKEEGTDERKADVENRAPRRDGSTRQRSSHPRVSRHPRIRVQHPQARGRHPGQ
jgi:predicted dithiol-disulfide oxidoreductase (DUF899 family)